MGDDVVWRQAARYSLYAITAGKLPDVASLSVTWI